MGVLTGGGVRWPFQAGQDHRPSAVELGRCVRWQLIMDYRQAARVADRLDLPGHPGGAGPLVTDLRPQLVRLLENRNRGVVVLPNDLMEAADPEQRLTLAAHIAELAIQLPRPLEQGQFARVLGQLLLFLV